MRGISIPEEVSNRSRRSLNLSRDFLRVVSFHLLYWSLIVISFTTKYHKGSRRFKRFFLCVPHLHLHAGASVVPLVVKRFLQVYVQPKIQCRTSDTP